MHIVGSILPTSGTAVLCPYRVASKLSRSQPAGYVLGVVCQDDVGAGPLDAGYDLEDGAALVEPAVGYRGLHHGVFAAHVVGPYGDVEGVADAPNYVEVRERGLHHDHVGAFVEIEGDFFQGFAGVGGIHLVAAAIAELRRGLGGFAERAVEGGAVLGGVGEDREILEFVVVEFVANGAYAAVHHVGGGDDIRTGACVREGLVGQDRERGIVGDFPVFDYAAVAVVGVFTEADVGDDDEFEIRFADGFDGALDYTVRGGGVAAGGVFRFGQAEEYYARDAE